MKKTPSLLVSLALLINASCVTAMAQGTVFFSNGAPGGRIDAPVYMSDGVTPLSGPQFMADLLGGPSASNLASIAMTGFLTGAGAGYFNGGTVSISSVAPGSTAWVQVDVWNTASGSTFTQAKASGLPNSWWQSSVFTVTTGGGTINPFPPGALAGLGTSRVYLNSVPEPCTLALAALGASMVLLHVRRRDQSGV